MLKLRVSERREALNAQLEAAVSPLSKSFVHLFLLSASSMPEIKGYFSPLGKIPGVFPPRHQDTMGACPIASSVKN